MARKNQMAAKALWRLARRNPGKPVRDKPVRRGYKVYGDERRGGRQRQKRTRQRQEET